jgi:pyroglutamyl-peptidase
MKKLLLSGFVPFLDFPVNPSEQIVRALDGECIGDYQVVGRVLPVEFARSGPEMLQYYEEIQPDAVISLGLAGGRNAITPERVAINCIDGEADNSGVRYEDQPIVEGGPAAYMSTLPIRKMVNALRENGLPAEISNTAGLYLCNNVMYHVLHKTQSEGRKIPAGFIHIPASHELAVRYKRPIPSWSLDSLIKGIRICIETLSHE